MLEKGIIRDGDPIELLEGLLVRKNRNGPLGEGHGFIVRRLATAPQRDHQHIEQLGGAQRAGFAGWQRRQCAARSLLGVGVLTAAEQQPQLSG